VEPYAGAASILLSKDPSPFEVLNDLDGKVVNFFRVLRERTQDLIRVIELTPYSRAEQSLSWEVCTSIDFDRTPWIESPSMRLRTSNRNQSKEFNRRKLSTSEDELERARRFYVQSWQAYGGLRSGWRYQKSNAGGKSLVKDWNDTERLYAVARRLKKVQLDSDDALSVIARFDTPSTLFYNDPPYLPETRVQKIAYRHEMTPEQHEQLAFALHNIKGMAIISHYPCEVYDLLYKDWRKVSCQTTNLRSDTVTECLWLSPSVLERQGQLGLWE
jgi:DNA adenine methylase